MNVLLDTNVLIAAFVARGACHELFEHVARHHVLVSSSYILGEFERKLVLKLGFTREEARAARSLVFERATMAEDSSLPTPPTVDPDDIPVLSAAVAARCDCVLTGDKELVALGRIEGVPIMLPSAFWRFESERSGSGE